MKSGKFFTVSVFVLTLLLAMPVLAQEKQVDWDRFSVNLEIALKSGHPGLRQSAMQQVIKYADNLQLNDGVYRMGRIFCYGTNAQERRLALVALSKINTLQSMAYIYKGMLSEDNQSIKKQGCCIIQEYCLANLEFDEDDVRLAALEIK